MRSTLAALGAALLLPLGLAAPAQAQAPQNYRVEVVNFSGETFDEIVVAVSRHSNPASQLLHSPPLPPGNAAQFDLGTCADVAQFAVAGVKGGVSLFNTGNIQGDPVGCDDQIVIRNTN
ncbi:hypothetical protein D5S17_28425 [Pseudonocardiaceae bacterium YIM PH 21723]|nr:hypothetical protein D5S17_28425 [Pseudonocardiaceae bacterium YIM PH 21723]